MTSVKTQELWTQLKPMASGPLARIVRSKKLIINGNGSVTNGDNVGMLVALALQRLQKRIRWSAAFRLRQYGNWKNEVIRYT